MSEVTDIESLSDRDLERLFEGMLNAIKKRPMEFRRHAQQIVNYCCRNQSLLRLENDIGPDEHAAFKRGASGGPIRW